MTWGQAVTLGVLIFGVGWVVEVRLDKLIRQLDEVRFDVDGHVRDIITELRTRT